MKVAIVGTRGVPNNYGGFEQFAEYLSRSFIDKGHEVTVYNSHNHPYTEPDWHGVTIVHKFDPEFIFGSFGQFIYDFNSIWHARHQRFDIILQLGYTSSSIWSFLFPKDSIVITNMDGLEWKRSKYSAPVQKFLKYAEYLAAVKSDYLVADSLGIKDYLSKEYNLDSVFIPYGAHPFDLPDETVLRQYELSTYNYDMLIARMEPENSIEVILDGVVLAGVARDFLVVGRTTTPFGKRLRRKFGTYSRIRFLEAIYDINVLNNLRYYSNLYFHGHSVGGTNPSLLEAMASGALICAHSNAFNSSILGEDAFYFSTPSEVSTHLRNVTRSDAEIHKTRNNFDKVKEYYNWEKVIDQYESFFITCLNGRSK